MQVTDIEAFWERFPNAVTAISKLDLVHSICLPTPATETAQAIYETYRRLVWLEAMLCKHRSSDEMEDLSFRCYDVTD